jgi:peptidoglycan hydrolase-like protein with peptidoglycan-binding domain
MRRLIFTTVSAIALVGGGLAYAAGNMGGNAANPAASPPPTASGTTQPGMTGSNAGASGASSMPSTTGTSQWGMSGQMNRHDEVSQVQQKLRVEGLYHGNIDGIAGPQTKQALRQYQQQNGLPVTANLDRQTLDHLLGSPPGGQGSSIAPNQAGGSTTSPSR